MTGRSRQLAFPESLHVDKNSAQRAGVPVIDRKLKGRELTLSLSAEPHGGQPWLSSKVYAPPWLHPFLTQQWLWLDKGDLEGRNIWGHELEA